MSSLKLKQVKDLLIDSEIDFIEISDETIKEIFNAQKEQIPEYMRKLIFDAVRENKEKFPKKHLMYFDAI